MARRPRENQTTCSATPRPEVRPTTRVGRFVQLAFVYIGVAESGGSIKLGKCGEACGAKTNSSQWIGWLGVLVAIVALGSNYVPVKKFDTGDGTECSCTACVPLTVKWQPFMLFCCQTLPSHNTTNRHVLPVAPVSGNMAGWISS